MIGHTVAQYRIVQRLGGGSMGVVYRGEDTRLERTVVLKFLPVELSGDAGAKERFLREARAASRLDHPNICTIFEFGETDDGLLYIVMPFYEGETLERRVAAGPLSTYEALEVAWQIARALAKAHSLGIVHRDVKPANVLITAEGEVKVLDFGLAKLADEAVLTRTGSSIGTPLYMSPEQIGGKTDARTDVWSLGVLLYEMLTGQRPFGGGSPAAAMYHILHREPPQLTDLRPGLPDDLQAILDLALAKDPDQRYATMVDFAEDLALAGAAEGSATQPMTTFSPREPSATVAAATAAAARRAAARRRWRIAALAAALAVGAAALTAAMKQLWPDAGERSSSVARQQSPAALAKRRPRLAKELAEAQAAYASGDDEKAERLYRDVLDRHPEVVEAWSGLGETKFHYGPLDGRSRRGSRSAWRRAVALEPDDFNAQLHLARLDLYDQDFARLQERLPRLEKLLAGTDQAGEVLFYRAHLPAGEAALEALAAGVRARSLALGWMPGSFFSGSSWSDPELWLPAVEGLLAGERTPRERSYAHRLIGILQLALGRLETAGEELRQASPPPEMPEEYSAIAATVPFLPVPGERLAELRDTVGAWPRAATVDPAGFSPIEPHALMAGHLQAYVSGLLAARLDDPVAALRHADELISLGELRFAPGLHLDLAAGIRAEVARLAGDSEEVLGLLGQRRGRYSYQLAVFSPVYSQVRERWLRAEALFDLGRLEEAEGWYESLAELNLFDLAYLGWSHLRRGEIAQRRGRPQEARGHYGRFLRLWRDCDPVLRPHLAAAEAAILASD